MRKAYKNGAEKRQEILNYINEMVSKPITEGELFKRLKKRMNFKSLTEASFYYSMRILIEEKKVFVEISRDIHPKRKPTRLINSLNNYNHV